MQDRNIFPESFETSLDVAKDLRIGQAIDFEVMGSKWTAVIIGLSMNTNKIPIRCIIHLGQLGEQKLHG